MANAATGLHHELDDDLLGQYLSRIGTIPGLRAPVLTKKIGYGQSNPTYFLDDAAYVQTRGRPSTERAIFLYQEQYS